MVECQNCQWRGQSARCDHIDPATLPERVAPGERMPYGQCPECGAVCHAIRPPQRSYIDGYLLDPSMIQWRYTGDETHPEASMLGVINILTVLHHIEAIEVDRHGEATNPECTAQLELLREMAEGDKLDTVQIGTRHYVIWMYPFTR